MQSKMVYRLITASLISTLLSASGTDGATVHGQVTVASQVRSNASAIRVLQYNNCVPPPNAVTGEWYYGFDPTAHIGCTSIHGSRPWVMLNAYRGGGTQGSFWRYKDSKKSTAQCLKNWTYYSKGGTWVVAKDISEWTTKGESKEWCALSRYRKDGKQGYQWNYCTCDLTF